MGESKIRFGTALLAVGALAVLLTTAIACSASDEEEAAPAAAARELAPWAGSGLSALGLRPRRPILVPFLSG